MILIMSIKEVHTFICDIQRGLDRLFYPICSQLVEDFISKPVVRYIDLCRTYNGSSGMGIPPIYSLHRFVLRWCEII